MALVCPHCGETDVSQFEEIAWYGPPTKINVYLCNTCSHEFPPPKEEPHERSRDRTDAD